MSLSPAPDPPPPPIGLAQETPLRKAIQFNVSTTHTNLEKNKKTVINPVDESKSKPQIPDKILEQLDWIERRSLIPAPPPLPPATWASAVHSSKKKTNPSKEQLYQVPSNAEMNQYKKASIVIHTPLDSMSAAEITSKINNAFISINALVKSQIIEASENKRVGYLQTSTYGQNLSAPNSRLFQANFL
ncbi:hypothetical protein PTTG_26609 [Puccinia triticina 1-1 BBBD Race 1]|uniref:Uncharacterized protein n=1 Tax=Puccinia triticina (isolate 1-1 / race 1 (BBBD)) TaxID=630390 RepID=A0A180GSV8_PUCT1|nr:hypothetical protein PTTG_26609 [Puccinia triticina 1-1 BBBD Race 1]